MIHGTHLCHAHAGPEDQEVELATSQGKAGPEDEKAAAGPSADAGKACLLLSVAALGTVLWVSMPACRAAPGMTVPLPKHEHAMGQSS